MLNLSIETKGDKMKRSILLITLLTILITYVTCKTINIMDNVNTIYIKTLDR